MKTTLLQYYEEFHAVTKYVNTVICNDIAVTYVKSREISQ